VLAIQQRVLGKDHHTPSQRVTGSHECCGTGETFRLLRLPTSPYWMSDVRNSGMITRTPS
jgi:hypothetical protein